jgi:hypothetical protein
VSERPESAAGVDAYVQPYLDFWTGYFNQAAESTRGMFESAHGGADPRGLQRRWLEAISRSMDAYLRSPLFLNAMKQNMDAAVNAKLQADDMNQEFARNANIPTAADIAGLFERLRSVEDMIVSRLDDIDQRLDTIVHGESTDEDETSATSSKKRITPMGKKKPRD